MTLRERMEEGKGGATEWIDTWEMMEGGWGGERCDTVG